MTARKGMIRAKHDKICNICGEKFKGVKQARYCEEHRSYAHFLNNMKKPEWRIKRLVSMAKNRAISKGLLFNITTKYMLKLLEDNQGCCALTGQLFDLSSWGGKGQVNPRAPSIDRIKPNKGYTKGNVRLITYHMNVALSDFGAEEFEILVRAYTGVQS